MNPELQTLQRLSEEYFDLNGNHYEILDAPPTPLEFSRMAHISRPVVIKGVRMRAMSRWTDEYLTQRMGDRPVSVAVTPDGHADAVTLGPESREYFVEPYVQKETMASFLEKIAAGEKSTLSGSLEEIQYLQSQNGNMFSSCSFQQPPEDDASEFEPLLTDVPRDIPWCSEALGRPPDAVNLWIGNSKSITSIHSDPYENIYTVIRGEKRFTLLPPTEAWSLKERLYPHAVYTRSPSTSDLIVTPSPSTKPAVRWSSIAEPHLPGRLPREAHPIEITLRAGESLYLPVGWFHHVRQSGITIALNYWYDVEVRGMGWLWYSFLRGHLM